MPGGAAKRITENIALVMESAMKRVSDFDCGEETSCYRCLRTYRNARDHERLSRRGALSLLEPGDAAARKKADSRRRTPVVLAHLVSDLGSEPQSWRKRMPT